MRATLSPKIALIDSGVGGLSLLTELQSAVPRARFYYCSDNELFPYGKIPTPQTLIKRMLDIVEALDFAYDLDMVIIACNTASTVCLPALRQRFSMQVVGVVPAIKPAAEMSQSKVIGLLATEGTISRDYTRKLIADFAANCQIIAVGSAKLVELAEQKIAGHKISPQELLQEVEVFFRNSSLDVVVLACTHFVHLRSELMQCSPRKIHWIDSNHAVVKRVKALLGQMEGGFADYKHPAYATLFKTKKDFDYKKDKQYFLKKQFGINKVSYLQVD